MRSDAQQLAAIRARYAAIAPARHALVWDGEGALVVADGTGGEKFEIARILPVASNDEREFLGEAAGAVGFLLKLVDRAIEAVRTGKARKADRPSPDHSGAPAEGQPPAGGGAAREPNYSAEAAIKCGEPAFKRFLMERHGLDSPATDERAAQKLRSLLGVTSRRELNFDAAAAARWKALCGEFEMWKRAGP